MKKKFLLFILVFIIFISYLSLNTLAVELTNNQKLAIQNQYSATVYKYKLNRNTVEKIEDAIIVLIALYPEADFTKIIDSVQKDAEEIYKLQKCKSVFDGLPEKSNTMKILSEGGNQEDFIKAVVEKIKFLYENYNNISDDNALKYTTILYIENYTKKIIEISHSKSNQLENISISLANPNSDIMKAKKTLLAENAVNLLVTKTDDSFSNTQSGMGADTLNNTFLQQLNGGYYFTNELLIGKALSATYVPLRSNIYDNPFYNIPASENYKLFDEKYGDLRKAVFISTSNKSVSQYYITGEVNSFRPALLRDFIENTDDEKLFITDPSYYNVHLFDSVVMPEKDERIKFEIKQITDLNNENIYLPENNDKDILPEQQEKNITDTTTTITSLLDTIFSTSTIYAAVSDMYSDEWKEAAKKAKEEKDFIVPDTYYPEKYMPIQNDLEDSIKKILDGISNQSIQQYITAASKNSNSPVSFYIMHCLGWAMRAESLNFISDNIELPENLYSDKYFRDVMHYYLDKNQKDKFIDFCISQSILYKRINFKYTNLAIRNLRNVIYSYDLEKKERDEIFIPFLYDLSIVEDRDVPNGKFESFWYWITGNNTWKTNTGKTKYAIVDADTVRWMYSTGMTSSDGQTYQLMEKIRKENLDKLNESDKIYKEIWKQELPKFIDLLKQNQNLVNETENYRDSFGAWADVIAALFSTGKITSYGDAEDMTIEQRKQLIQILPSSFEDAIKSYTEILDAIEKISNYEDIVKLFRQYSFEDKENQSDQKKRQDDPILKRTGSMQTLDGKSVEELSQNLSEYNNIKTFFSQWKESKFSIKQNKVNQVLALGSKALNDVLNQEVIQSLSDVHYPVNKWYGLLFILDIFKDSNLGKMITGAENKPIFRSSPNDVGVYADAQFNWLLLKNIEETYPIRYDAVLDLDSPVFVDIYGNIISESGLVIVPYAANATIHKQISLLNATFLSTYGKKEYIKKNEETNAAYIRDKYINLNTQCYNLTTDYAAFLDTESKEILISDELNDYYFINGLKIKTDIGSIDLARIDTVNESSAAVLYNLELSMYTEKISSDKYIMSEAYINVENDISNILYQVLRGAFIENIDYVKENLNEGINYDKIVLSQALKYERLVEQMSSVSENSLITIPDLTDIPVVKYIVFFLYRILIIIFTFYVLLQIYLSTVTQQLNIGTLSKIIMAFICIGVTIFSIPLVYKYSYYTTTRALLQDEAMTIAMLNEEKRNNNIELGIIKAQNPKINSKLTLKVENIKVDYIRYISAMIDAYNVTEMEDIYEREIAYSLESDVNEYELRGSSLYLDVDTLFASSQIFVDTTNHKLKQVVSGEPAISFRLPYYVILDYLIQNINQYNDLLQSQNYSVQIMGDGKIRSIGLSERYFRSNAFNITRNDLLENIELFSNMDENIKSFIMYDKTGIFSIYDYKGYDNRTIFPNRKPLLNSQWYVDELSGDKDKIIELSELLDAEAVQWMKKHENIIGRISDETILKALALDLSLKYNEILNVLGPQKIEIESISTEDIIRLCCADSGFVLTASPYSYPKFILLSSGLSGIYIGAIITLVTFILGIIKPLVTLGSFLVLIASLVILRILFHRKTANLKGFVKFIFILTVVNLSYCVILKIFMILPFGIPSLVRLIFFLIVQIIYTAIYFWIMIILVFNWKDIGNNAFNNAITLKSLNIKKISEYNSPSLDFDYENSWKVYKYLKETDNYRKEHRKRTR